MTSLLFLAADAESPIVSDKQPLLNPEVRSIAAAYITLGASKQDFFKTKRWIPLDEDDAIDISNTFSAWIAADPPLYIFAFDAPFVLRRIAAYCLSMKVKCIPAYYWCGTKSRTVDLCYFLSGERDTSAPELIKAAGITVPAYYEPHQDAVDDIKYLLSLADKYGIVRIQIEEILEEVPTAQDAVKVQVRTKKVTKNG